MRASAPLGVALLSAFACAAGVAAQTGRAVTKVGTAVDFPTLGPSTSPGSVFANLIPAVSTVQTFEFLPMLDAAGNRSAGQFHCTLTVTRSTNSTEIMMGTLDTTTSPWSFTDTTAANLGSLNTTTFFHGTMTPDLLVFAADSPSGSFYSVRTSRSQAFPALKQVGQLTGFVDSKLFTWNNSDWYTNAETSTGTIDLWQFDRTAYATSTDPRTGAWTFVGSPGSVVHATELLIDQAGDGRAILHSADEGGQGVMARPYFNGLVMQGNVQTSRKFHNGPADTTQFLYPSALAGSFLYAVRDTTGNYVVPKLIRAVASNGDGVDATGGTFHLSAWLPYFDRSNPPTVDWAVLILIGVPGPDIAVPGFRGKLALGLTPPFVALPARAWGAETLSADWIVPAPALPAGTTLWTQTLAYDGAGSVNGDTFYFGNTTRLVWQ